MEETLNSINTLSDLLSATCIRKIKRSSGYSSSDNCLLMQGKKTININKGTKEQTENIDLIRLMSKVEISFSNHLNEGEFVSFSLGNFPEFFSAFQTLYYKPSENSYDTGKIWESSIVDGESYMCYIPPYHYSSPDNTDGKELNFTFKWLVNNLQYIKICPFRESDEATDVFDVKSNYHYKYNIRLINKPKDPLLIECKMIPWFEEEEVHFYANSEFNLSIERKIENGKSLLQLTLQNINDDPSLDMSSYYVNINQFFGYNYDVYINGTYINSGEAWLNGSYKYFFRNGNEGKSVIVIKPSEYYPADWTQKYGDCMFNGYTIDLERLN